MPRFFPMSFENKIFQLTHTQSDMRSMIGIVPYFWDSEVCFDLVVKIPPKEKRELDEQWEYEWELCGLDDLPVKPVIKNNIHVSNKGFRRKLSNWSSGKLRAINLGYLLPNKHYRLYMRITNPMDKKSKKFLAGTFTIKDRDEYYMQIFLILFTVTMTLFFSLVLKTCGLPA